MHTPIGHERRRQPRYNVAIALGYIKSHNGSAVGTQTHDISGLGICMVVYSRDLLPGTVIDLWLRMADNGEKIYRRGTIVWSAPSGADSWRVGVRLDEPQLRPIPLVLRTIQYLKDSHR